MQCETKVAQKCYKYNRGLSNDALNEKSNSLEDKKGAIDENSLCRNGENLPAPYDSSNIFKKGHISI